MNRLELTAAAAFLLMLTQAEASGPSTPRIEPEPTRPVCYNLFGLPCHEPGKPTTMDGSKQPTPKPEPKPCASNDWTFGQYATNGGKKGGKQCA